MGYIENTFIGALDENQQVTSPPERMLEVMVIAGIATLRFRRGDHLTPEIWAMDEQSVLARDDPPSIDVPARSLLVALQALIADDELPQPAGEHTP